MKKILIALLIFLATQKITAQDTIHAAKPFILGSIENLYSKVLVENRALNIYLPDGYNENDTTHYPVIYLLDGSANEDFIHVSGIVQFANSPWVNILPKSIVVGIANVDRRRDLTYPTTIEKDKKAFPTTGGSEKFINFIENELQPFVNKKFKTSESKMLIGESFGGLLAAEILFKRPRLFNQYVIVSPSLWWDNESLLSLQAKILQPGYSAHTDIFLAVGKEGDIMENDVKKLDTLLTKTTFSNLLVTFQYYEKEDHATIMHRAVYDAFENFSKLKK